MTLQETIRLAIQAYFDGAEYENTNKLKTPLKYNKKYFDEKHEKYKALAQEKE